MSKWKKILRRSLQLLLVAAFVFVFVSAVNRQQVAVCSKMDIQIESDASKNFLDEQAILQILKSDGALSLPQCRLAEVNLAMVEGRIRAVPYVRDVNVFVSPENALCVEVEQKEPVLRIMHNSGVSYYLTDKKEIIPLSDKFTPRLLVAIGNFAASADSNKPLYDDLYRIDSFMKTQSLWNAVAEQVYVEKEGSYYLTHRIAPQPVQLGDAENLKDKLRRLEIFYRECFGKVDWEQYKMLSVKYDGQIVATKK